MEQLELFKLPGPKYKRHDPRDKFIETIKIYENYYDVWIEFKGLLISNLNNSSTIVFTYLDGREITFSFEELNQLSTNPTYPDILLGKLEHIFAKLAVVYMERLRRNEIILIETENETVRTI